MRESGPQDYQLDFSQWQCSTGGVGQDHLQRYFTCDIMQGILEVVRTKITSMRFEQGNSFNCMGGSSPPVRVCVCFTAGGCNYSTNTEYSR